MAEGEVDMIWNEFLDEEMFSECQKFGNNEDQLSFDNDLFVEQNTQSSVGGDDTEVEDLSLPMIEMAPSRSMLSQPEKERLPCQGSLLDPTSSFWKRVKVTIRASAKQQAKAKQADDEQSADRRSLVSLEMDAVSDSSEDVPAENAVSSDLYDRLRILMRKSSQSPRHKFAGISKRGGVKLPEIGPVLRGVKAAAIHHTVAGQDRSLEKESFVLARASSRRMSLSSKKRFP